MRNFRIFIPARLNSTRLPRKLLLRANGKPLILHTVDAVQRASLDQEVSPFLQGVYVLADSKEIVDVVEKYCSKMSYPVTCKLSRAKIRNGTERIGMFLGDEDNLSGDLAVNWQADEPMINSDHIVALVSNYDTVPGCDIHTLATGVNERYCGAEFVYPVPCGNGVRFRSDKRDQREKIVSEIFSASSFLRGCSAYRHIGIYAGSERTFGWYSGLEPSENENKERLEQMRVIDHGGRINVSVVKYNGVSVDTEEDFVKFCKVAN